MDEMTKDYGNVFQITLLTDTRVRVFVSYLWNIKKNLHLQLITVEPHHVKVLEPSSLHIYS